jgi:hypothetical protein
MCDGRKRISDQVFNFVFAPLLAAIYEAGETVRAITTFSADLFKQGEPGWYINSIESPVTVTPLKLTVAASSRCMQTE